MKKKLLALICLIFLSSSINAQEKKSGPPKAKEWKGKGEKIEFPSLPTLTIRDFLLGKKPNREITIWGTLNFPTNAADKNVPAVVILHGMGGVNDGTVWSTRVSGGIGPYANGFDGSTSTYMYPRNQDAEGNLVFAGGLPCDAVYCNTYSSSGTEFFTDSASSPTSVI